MPVDNSQGPQLVTNIQKTETIKEFILADNVRTLMTRGRFLKGGINYIRYNSYSRDKSAMRGITIRGIKNGFPEALFILGIAIPGISLLF